MTDAAAKHRSVRQGPRQRRRGFDGKAEEGATRFLLASLSQQKQGPPRRLGPESQPPALSQPEAGGIAAHFQDDHRKGRAGKRRFRQPERFLQLARRCLQEGRRLQSEITDTDGIGQARLHRGDRIADPENRGYGRICAGGLRMEPRGKSKGKAAGRPGIPQAERADFRQRIQRHTALHRGIEVADPGRKQWLGNTRRTGLWLLRQHLMRRRSQSRYRPAFQSGNGFTQGKKRFPRHGGFGHDVHSRSIMFLLCSYGFQRSEKESTPIYKKIFLCVEPDGLSLFNLKSESALKSKR